MRGLTFFITLWVLLLTSAREMRAEDSTYTALADFPFVYVSDDPKAKGENGILADVAPTILHIMGLKQPAEMTGKNLIG